MTWKAFLFYFVNTLPVWLGNELISARLILSLIHTENHLLTSYYRHFSTNMRIKIVKLMWYFFLKTLLLPSVAIQCAYWRFKIDPRGRHCIQHDQKHTTGVKRANWTQRNLGRCKVTMASKCTKLVSKLAELKPQTWITRPMTAHNLPKDGKGGFITKLTMPRTPSWWKITHKCDSRRLVPFVHLSLRMCSPRCIHEGGYVATRIISTGPKPHNIPTVLQYHTQKLHGQ